MASNHLKNNYLIAAIVLLTTPISGLAIDIFVPSLPAITHYFAVDKSLAQLAITTYMAGLGLVQLFAGSISDSFGRKIPFTVSMVIFILATLLVPVSNDINQLLILRFIQGASVGLTVVPIRAVITDIFESRELKKMMNYMTMAWAIGPIIAPALGGYLQHYFNWQACFYFLAIYSSILFILSLLFLPETTNIKHPFKIREILIRYQTILLDREYQAGLLTNSLLYSLVILFSVVAPFLLQNVLHYSPIQFGYVSLLMGFAWFLGTVTNRFVIDVPLFEKAKFCFWSMLAISITMLTAALIFQLNIYNVVVPSFILYWLGGVVFPNNFVRSIARYPKSTGSANALFSGFLFFIVAVASALGTLLKSSSELPLAAAYVTIMILCLALFFIDQKASKQKKPCNNKITKQNKSNTIVELGRPDYQGMRNCL